MISALRGRIAELENELSRMGLALTSEENSHDNWKDRTEGDPGNKLFVTLKRAHPINETRLKKTLLRRDVH